MPEFRVTFRDNKDDQVIEAHMVLEGDKSYVFYKEGGDIIAQVPCDVVLSVVEEGAARGRSG